MSTFFMIPSKHLQYAHHVEQNRQQRTDMHSPFSTTFMEIVTNSYGITTISTEKAVKEIAILANKSGG
jgi:hypothetical protein